MSTAPNGEEDEQREDQRPVEHQRNIGSRASRPPNGAGGSTNPVFKVGFFRLDGEKNLALALQKRLPRASLREIGDDKRITIFTLEVRVRRIGPVADKRFRRFVERQNRTHPDSRRLH